MPSEHDEHIVIDGENEKTSPLSRAPVCRASVFSIDRIWAVH
jgi:hypothetical protein